MYRSLEGCKRLVAKVLSAAVISIAKSILQPSRLRGIIHSNPGRAPQAVPRALQARASMRSGYSGVRCGLTAREIETTYTIATIAHISCQKISPAIKLTFKLYNKDIL